jgi:hypothetical protein
MNLAKTAIRRFLLLAKSEAQLQVVAHIRAKANNPPFGAHHAVKVGSHQPRT